MSRVMPHYFGIKRPCLERDYYEQFNSESVHLFDIKNNPIMEFTETCMTLEGGTRHELDGVAFATGFVSSTRNANRRAHGLTFTGWFH